MEKLLLAAIAIGSVFTASAQTKTTFGISGVLNLPTSILPSADRCHSFSQLQFSDGLMVKATYSFGANQYFSVRPGWCQQ